MIISLSTIAGKILKLPVILELNDVPFSFEFNNIIQREKNKVKRVLLRIIRPIFRFDIRLTSKLSTKIITTAKIKIPNIKKSKISSISFGANISIFKPKNKIECRKILDYPKEIKIIC